MLRLIFLFIGFMLVSQVWSYVPTKVSNYHYDTIESLRIDPNINSEAENNDYDDARNLRYCCSETLNSDSQEKALDGYFLALLSDFIVTKGVLNPQQVKNLARFNKKKPANSTDTVIRDLPGGGKAFQADSAARNIPGSFARFEKQIDSAGKTTQFTKTTFGPKGEIVHVKDKITGQTFIPGQ